MSYSACDFVEDVCMCVERKGVGDFTEANKDEDTQTAAGVVIDAIDALVAQRDALVAALERISNNYPTDCDEPIEEDYDDTESAYNNGSDVAAHEAATIARAALALAKGE